VLCCFFLLLICCEAGVVIAWLALAMKRKMWRDLFNIIPLATAILGLSCSIDILISGTLCILLYLSRTGFKRSDSMINKLILFIISTGSLTAMFAIVALICLFSIPYSLAYGALYQSVGYLYTNSFLTTLNRRSTADIVEGTELRLTNVAFQEVSTGKLGNAISDAYEEAVPDMTVLQRMGEPAASRASGLKSDNHSAQQAHFFGDLA